MIRAAFVVSLLPLSIVTAIDASIIDLNLPGTADYDGWQGLTAANYPGYGAFPGLSDWPAPIGSNTAGSGDAELAKLLNGAGGGPHPSSTGIYFGGFSGTPNTFGGALGVIDAAPVADLANVVLQVEIGEAYGFDFHNDVPPALGYNGGSQALAPDVQILVDQVQTGWFTDPSTGLQEPIFLNTYLFQWDLSGVVEPISGFGITFSGVQHAQLSELRVDQSDVYQAISIPEPSGIATALALCAAALARRGRRGRAA